MTCPQQPCVLLRLLASLCTNECVSRQVKDASSGYLANKSNVRILVEWLQSSVLFQSTYHNYDDVSRDEGRSKDQLAIKLVGWDLREFIGERVRVAHRLDCLQWHRIECQSGYSDSFDKTQIIDLLMKCLCLATRPQLQAICCYGIQTKINRIPRLFARSVTFGCSHGCHCNWPCLYPTELCRSDMHCS